MQDTCWGILSLYRGAVCIFYSPSRQDKCMFVSVWVSVVLSLSLSLYIYIYRLYKITETPGNFKQIYFNMIFWWQPSREIQLCAAPFKQFWGNWFLEMVITFWCNFRICIVVIFPNNPRKSPTIPIRTGLKPQSWSPATPKMPWAPLIFHNKSSPARTGESLGGWLPETQGESVLFTGHECKASLSPMLGGFDQQVRTEIKLYHPTARLLQPLSSSSQYLFSLLLDESNIFVGEISSLTTQLLVRLIFSYSVGS